VPRPHLATQPRPDWAVAWVRRLAAEVLGTFALVFVAAGADTMAALSGGQIGTAARAVAPGLMVGALIYAIADTSGAHFNPVVSLAFTLKRLFPASWLVPYWLSQLTGGLLAVLLLRTLFGSTVEAAVSRPHGVDAGVAVAIEATLTFLLVTVILGTADRARIVGPNAALAVGATIALCGLIALPIEGASMNPVRSAAPAIVTGDFSDLWIYVVGPLIGAILATAAAWLLHGPEEADGGARNAARGSEYPSA
jgi:aquaporin Z